MLRLVRTDCAAEGAAGVGADDADDGGDDGRDGVECCHSDALIRADAEDCRKSGRTPTCRCFGMVLIYIRMIGWPAADSLKFRIAHYTNNGNLFQIGPTNSDVANVAQICSKSTDFRACILIH